ncbi:MAG: PC4/YdbC family ssDNA-binding protein [Oscillospiraceae bacterium]|nr:PC4/YdbC family ssDNA-binding protein [Oscillospiraceae bacterium]MDD4367892.1 PC4/YdbC family ssDNA-binding protein [Oscillospiraceae bacterium]
MERKGESNRDSKARDRDPISFEIKDYIGCLSTSASGWRREVNIVSWNHKAARLDIRDWSPDHGKMSRGIGLSGPEVENLASLLQGFDVLQAGI